MASSAQVRVWVVAPLNRPGAEAEPVQIRDEPASESDLAHSLHDASHYLLHRRRDLTDRPELGARRIELVTVMDQDFLTAELALGLDPADETGAGAEPAGAAAAERRDVARRIALEIRCREAVDAIRAVEGLDDRACPWVNRTLVVDSIEEVADSWLSSRHEAPRLGWGAGVDSSLIVSWGNNLVSADAYDDPDLGPRIREGLVDSQFIWADVERISTRADEIVRKQIQHRDAVAVGDGQTEALVTALSRHNLLYDDILFHAARTRSETTRAVLQAWSYPLLRDRLAQRVRDADSLERRRTLRREARHDTRVSRVLLVLSLVSAAQLTLALIALAYTGAVTSYPGARPWSLLSLVRGVDSDIWILLTVIALGVVYVFVDGRGRRRDES